MKCFGPSCIVFGLVLLPALVWGLDINDLEIPNPNPVGAGARALGQANAFIAVADDATVASWNPAGLTQLEKPEFSFAVEHFPSEVDTTLGAGWTGGGSRQQSLYDFNYASLVLPLNQGKHMVFSLNYFKKLRFDKEQRIAGTMVSGMLTENRESEEKQTGAFSVLSPAFAIDLTPKFSAGLALGFWADSLTGDSKYKKTQSETSDITFAGIPFPGVTSSSRLRFTVEDGISLTVGGLYRLNEAWSFGAVAHAPYQLDLSAQNWLDGVPGTPRDAELEFPWVLGLGAAWRPHDAFTASCDLTWTDWSEFRYRDETGVDVNPLDKSVRRPRDTYTVRLGCEYLIIRQNYVFPLRFGLGYDPAPGLGRVDDYFTVNAGVGVQIKDRINLDVGYQYRWGNDVNRDYYSLGSSEDIRQQRIVLSAIYYF